MLYTKVLQRGTTETIEEEGSERSMRRRTRKKKTDESGYDHIDYLYCAISSSVMT